MLLRSLGATLTTRRTLRIRGSVMTRPRWLRMPPPPGERASLVGTIAVAALGLVAVALSLVTPTISVLIYTGLGGAFFGGCLAKTMTYYMNRRWNRTVDAKVGLLPASVMLGTTDDGRHIATVERKNGELLTLEVPDWIEQPDQQFGEWLLREILPADMFAVLDNDEFLGWGHEDDE